MSTNNDCRGALLARSLDKLMRKVEAGVHARAVRIDADRIGPLGGMVLLTLAEIEPAPIQAIVRQTGRDKSQITRLIQVLEAKGALERQTSPDDGRVILLRRTPKGRALVDDLRRIMSDAMEDALAPVPAEQRTAFEAALLGLGAAL